MSHNDAPPPSLHLIGCTNCEVRRQVCDLTKPTCEQCHGAGYACIWDGKIEADVFTMFPPQLNLNGKIPAVNRDQQIGFGSFGDVYRATSTDGVFAVKIPRVKDLSETSLRRRLVLTLREALTWSGLVHPNVHALRGVTTDPIPNALCLVSDLMENGNVVEYTLAHPETDKLILLRGIAKGVSYLHQQDPPIVHGDLKGNNVLVSGVGESLLTDFGLSCAFEECESRLADDTSTCSKANARWAAPERISPDDYSITIQQSRTMESDVFSMLRTFLEVWTGVKPFHGMGDFEVISLVTSGENPSRPSRPLPELSDDFWKLMLHAWSRQPTQRPSSLTVENFMIDGLYRGASPKVTLIRLRDLPVTSQRSVRLAHRQTLLVDEPSPAARSEWPLSRPERSSSTEIEWTGELNVSCTTIQAFENHLDNHSQSVATGGGALDVDDFLHCAKSCLASYYCQSDQVDLQRSIKLFRKACDESGNGHGRLEPQNHLSMALQVLFEDMGTNSAIEEAIVLSQGVLSETHTNDPSRARRLRILGQALALKAKKQPKASEAPDILERAIRYLKESVQLTERESSDDALICLVEYARALRVKYASNVNTRDLYVALSLIDKALQLARPRDDHRLLVLSCSLDILSSLYAHTGDKKDIEQVMVYVQEALSLIRKGHRQRPHLLNHLGVAIFTKYMILGEADSLDTAIESLQDAAQDLTEHHELFFTVRINLYETLLQRCKDRSQPLDLLTAASGLREVLAVILRTQHHVDRFNCVYVIAKASVLEFTEHGKPDSLDAAIEFYQHSIEMAPPSALYRCYRGLAEAYHTRFSAHGWEVDLDEAVQFITKADRVCLRKSSRAQLSSYLGTFLTTRFTVRQQMDDINAAISALQSCLDCSDDETSCHSAVYRSSMGNAFLQKYLVYRHHNDLGNAISEQLKAIVNLPGHHSHLPSACAKLGDAYVYKFWETNLLEDLQHAIEAFERAVILTPLRHRNRATYLFQLGKALHSASCVTGNNQDMLRAIELLQEGARDTNSSLRSRFESASLWANIAHQNDMLERAIDAYRLAVDLLPRVTWLLIDHKSRLKWLSAQSGDMCRNAAACAVSLGAPEEAVEMLERGRSIIWNTSQNLRADISTLSLAHPHLAAEFQEVSWALDFRDLHIELFGDCEYLQDTSIRRRLADRWQELLHTVQQQMGFESFLKPPSFAELRTAAVGGVIVLVNESPFRSDALLVTEDHLVVIPLQRMNTEELRMHASLLNEALSGMRDEHQEMLIEERLIYTLRYLWDVLGVHVWTAIKALGIGDGPRVWWCPTGVLSRLPIHACGPYHQLQTGMADLVISSYIPTLSSLLRVKISRRLTPTAAPFRLLAIGMESIPDILDLELSGISRELSVLRGLPGHDTMTFLEGPEATIARVTKLMPARGWLHVAGHGIRNPYTPLESYLLLYDGVLPLCRIAQLRLEHAEFAFLSVCHSANADEVLPDEALHLAGGTLIAGYKGVLASLWSIADEDGATLARYFYEYLIRKNANPDAIEAAEALQRATRALRETPGMALWRWVPFVHLGL